MSPSYAPSCATRAAARASCGGLSFKCWVDTGFDGCLEFFDVGKVLFAGRGDWFRNLTRGVLRAGEHLLGELQRAFASEGQLLAIGQSDIDGATRARYQLFADMNPITLGQQAPRSIIRNRVHLADNLSDDTDRSSHDFFPLLP
ncbi:hypothetical protein NVV93_12755 [Pseudomonas sp. LS44]|nr:hypothetical protein [Pseudomonas sp. LS44]UVE16481.1 hypothetical protein NVV93_12755 [Pseudomonas sp. LS44]